jgi:hypothetical protein
MKQTIRNAALAALLVMAVTFPQIVRAQDLLADAQQTINAFKEKDPTLQRFFDSAVGYAVFPTIAKGGLIVGGAHGDGVVYQSGRPIGTASMTQGTFGAQVGGQTYSEIIFFQTPAALQDFKDGKFVMSPGSRGHRAISTRGRCIYDGQERADGCSYSGRTEIQFQTTYHAAGPMKLRAWCVFLLSK